MATSRVWLRAAVVTLMACGVLATPATSSADVEVTGVIGGLMGGDLNNVFQGTSSIKSTFDNGTLYGGRIGWIGKFGGAEGSFVGSPTGVNVSLPNRPVGVDGTVYYLEANALLVPIPGPISPFFRAGLGMHSYRLDLDVRTATASAEDINKLGYNFGAGVKINIGAFTIRGEAVDHITTLGPGDFDLGDIAEALGFDDDQRVHNVEISIGIGIRF